MIEIPAKGVTGFFLLNPFNWRHFFRVSSKSKSNFTDYDLLYLNLQVKILCGGSALLEREEGNHLDWSSDVVKKRPKATKETPAKGAIGIIYWRRNEFGRERLYFKHNDIDYLITIEDLQVEILSDVSLFINNYIGVKRNDIDTK